MQVNAKDSPVDGKMELSVIIHPEQEDNVTEEIETVKREKDVTTRDEIRAKVNWCCW